MTTAAVRNLFNPDMIEEVAAPGMKPLHQARSRELVVRMCNEGVALLNEVDFDELSIEALCQCSESTVGAFYSRFENKEGFVNVLQHLVVAATRRTLSMTFENGSWTGLEDFFTTVAKGALVWCRRYEGLVRASLRRANGQREMWTPLRELGELQVTLALPHALAFFPADAQGAAEARIRFAFQILFGTLNNIVLVNPGPFTLKDRQLVPMLARAMTRFAESTKAFA